MALTSLLHVCAFLAGLVLVAYTIHSAVRTFVVPRGVSDRLTALVFTTSRLLFSLRTARAQSYVERDRVMAFFAPSTLLMLPLVWLTLIILGYMGMFWAIGVGSARDAFTISGSSVLTLGFATGTTVPQTFLTFTEAALGLLLVALLIAYLPTMYSSWSKRESGVAMLEVWAGRTASPIRIILRYYGLGGHGQYQEFWAGWIAWFTDVAESHSSLAPLVFFRSPVPHRSWITAAGAILDMAALVATTLDLPRDAYAEVTIRSGYLALRQIADVFELPYDPDPRPDDEISVPRLRFDRACEELRNAGIVLKPDLDQAWRDFAGWRVNYDAPLRRLAGLTFAPAENWFPEIPARVRRELGEIPF